MKLRLCKCCGQLFEAQGKQLYCSATHYGICENCGSEFILPDIHYPCKSCSEKCKQMIRKKHAEETSLKLYGVKNAGFTKESQKKIHETCRKKYGVDWTGQSEIQKKHVQETYDKKGGNPFSRPEIRKQIEQTCMNKYGARNVLCKESSRRQYVWDQAMKKYGTYDPGNLPQFREKAKQTSIKHWGSEYYFQSEVGVESKKKGMIAKYGVDHPMKSKEILNKIAENYKKKHGVYFSFQDENVKAKISETVMKKYGVPYFCMHEKCKNALGKQPSKLNISFATSLSKETGLELDYEYAIERKCFDIRIESKKLLIEIDPTYTHTTEYTYYGKVDQNYHSEKTNVARSNGYSCIHIFDWDDKDKIIEMLAPKQNVYARNCEIKSVEKNELDSFLNMFHLQGSCRNQEYAYGLYYKGELLQVLTFGQPRYNTNFEWELLRLCTRFRYTVVGGASRLFKHFLDTVNPKSILSYCDNSKFAGNIYYRLGFILADQGIPSKHWSKYSKHITDNLLRQRGYDQLFNTNYGKGTSNEELMLANGWLPVYDCGQSRFEWRSTNK